MSLIPCPLTLTYISECLSCRLPFGLPIKSAVFPLKSDCMHIYLLFHLPICHFSYRRYIFFFFFLLLFMLLAQLPVPSDLCVHLTATSDDIRFREIKLNHIWKQVHSRCQKVISNTKYFKQHNSALISYLANLRLPTSISLEMKMVYKKIS